VRRFARYSGSVSRFHNESGPGPFISRERRQRNYARRTESRNTVPAHEFDQWDQRTTFALTKFGTSWRSPLSNADPILSRVRFFICNCAVAINKPSLVREGHLIQVDRIGRLDIIPVHLVVHRDPIPTGR
jgi:hypothetical protein